MRHTPPLRTSDLFRVLLGLQRAYAQSEVRFRSSLNLNDTDLRAVNLLRSRQTPSPGELARELGLSSAGITSVLDRLEARQMVQREHHGSDRRRTLVRPGRAFPGNAGASMVLLRGLHRFYSQLDEPTRLALGQLLAQIHLELEATGATVPAAPTPTPTTPRSSDQ